MRSLVKLLAVMLLVGCGTAREEDGAASRTSALSTNGVNADLGLQSDWGTGYCAGLTLVNTSSAPVSAWTAVVELNQSAMTQIWNGTAVPSGTRITISPMAWNSTLAPGASNASVGFCGSGTGANHRPVLVSLSVVGGGGSGSGGGAGGGPGSGGGSAGAGGGSGCSGPCNAATPVYPTLQSNGGLGNVTMYSTAASNGGACNYGSTSVMYYAAINVNVQPGDGAGQWQGGRLCGQCAEVTVLTSQGPKSVVVRIMDKCPDGHCGIDLGGSAPGTVMLNGSGRYAGQWQFVSCSGHPEVSDGAPSLTVVSGSNPWWSRVRVRNPVSAVQAIAWKSAAASGSFPFATDPENAFEVPVSQVLQSASPSFQITVSYAGGGTATVQLTPAQLAAGGSSYALR
jgi:hypothetical protein